MMQIDNKEIALIDAHVLYSLNIDPFLVLALHFACLILSAFTWSGTNVIMARTGRLWREATTSWEPSLL
jgi:hypothetical protein